MKNLLTENEIRKMMKYADMNKLADNFVSRLNETAETEPVEEAYMADDEEEVKEEGMGMMADDEPAMADDAPEMADEMDEEPPPVDEPEMDAGGAGDMDVEKLVSDLADVISRHTGVEVEVEDDAPADDMDMGGDDPAPMDEPAADMGGDDDAPMDEGEYMADDEPMEEEETLEEVVNLIARRVAKRILTEQ